MAPVLAVLDALRVGGNWEEVLAVEAGRAFGDSRVETVEVVGGSYHEDSVVGFPGVVVLWLVLWCSCIELLEQVEVAGWGKVAR